MKKNLILFLGILFVLVFSFSLIVASGCCSLTNGGAQCVNTLHFECADGADFSEGADCEFTSYCQEGCCYDEDIGVFDSRVLKTACDVDWVKNPTCDLPAAQRGCCVLGEETIYETEGQCWVDTVERALGPNSEVDWRAVDRQTCFGIAEYQSRGACVTDNQGCTFVTESECWEQGGQFSTNYLCTSPSLNTSCEMTGETSCVEGRDGVYFVDSCGNIANIYDSSKLNDPDYWSQVIRVESSCGFGDVDGNANSTSCGNCDRFAGGMCRSAIENNFDVNSGNFYCKDLSCYYNGTTYDNGESWCDYDGVIGNGLDPAGSRHWRYTCNYGEIQIDACDDYRNDICVQNFLKENAGEDAVDARCVKNDWRECIDYNEESDADGCNKNPFCEIREVTIDEFRVSICRPKYPGGFDFINVSEKRQEDNEEVCGLATRTCTSFYVKVFSGTSFVWKCQVNCECETISFVESMNDLCIGLGDCGGYVNYQGNYTDEGYDSNRGKIGEALISSYKNNIIPVPGLFIVMSEYLNATAKGEGSLGGSGGGYPERNIIQKLLGGIGLWGDIKSVKSTFTCKPWQPPVGGSDCTNCNNDPLRPCSNYRCESLGAGCEIVNKGTEEEMCDSGEDDGMPPSLGPSLETISDNEMYSNVGENGFDLTSKNGGCIPAYTPIEFGIVTNELAQCKFDIEMVEYEEMDYDLGGNNYIYDHKTIFTLPDPSHGQSQGLDWEGDLTFYIKCRDRFGHETPEFYTVDMCVIEGPDNAAPLIRRFDPIDNTLFRFGTTQANISIITNELATCRWSFGDVAYGNMENEMVCADVLNSPSSTQGYVCTDTLELVDTTNTYYIRCMDQPWLEGTADVGDRNPNQESTLYRLRVPEEMIGIEKISPDSDFESPTAQTEIELKVRTINGGEEHTCSYSFSGYTNMVEMFETGTVGTHVQPLKRPAGTDKIYIECVDESGDSVQGSTEFRIIHDTSTPQIARVWQIGNTLHLITVENSECVYSTENCNFKWEDGTSTQGGEEHTISVIPGKKYHIKCKDAFENAPLGCSISVHAI
ncbi:MAG: hypothetical protein KKF50_03620 [Nanoarchaeota archaeon]|nr:hypothetical protein [Nanoarchaeota archaeon]